MIDVVRRWWSGVKLRRGQCAQCGRPKRDDAAAWDRFCSQECHDEWHSRHDW